MALALSRALFFHLVLELYDALAQCFLKCLTQSILTAWKAYTCTDNH